MTALGWRWGATSACTALFVLGILPIRAQSNISVEPSEAPPPPDQITFFCRDIYNRVIGTKIHATLVWIPERQGNIRLINWKSTYFSKYGWTPQQRCDLVTAQFTKLHKDGQLKFLTTGYVHRYPVVCGLAQVNEVCDESRRLFTLKPHDNPSQVLKQILGIVRGKSGDILLQNSGGKTLVSVPEFFKKAPIIDEVPLGRRKSAGTQVNKD